MDNRYVKDEELSAASAVQQCGYCSHCGISDEDLSAASAVRQCVPPCGFCVSLDEELGGAAWAGNTSPYSSCVPSAPYRISDEDLSATSAIRQCLGCASCTTSDDEDLSGAALAGNNSCSRCTAYVD